MNDFSNERTIVAIFSDRDNARAAAEELADVGYHHTWVAATRPGHVNAPGAGAVLADDDMLAKVGRFFTGEGESSLGDALRKHGVGDADADRLEQAIPAGCAVLTVTNDPNDTTDESASRVIEQAGGRLMQGGGISDASLYDFSNAPGATATEERRLQLREERLSVDKQRVASGEASVRKNVVEGQQTIDVPTYHEELYVERRPVSSSATSATDAMIEGETVRIPLSEERVVVEKRPVTTEEVVIGKRRVEDTQRVSETVRKEVLDVDDPRSNDALSDRT